jgi:hypothetical protein
VAQRVYRITCKEVIVIMYKTVEPDSWSQLAAQGITNILPFRKSGGMSDADRNTFFKKTAASEKFLYEMREIKLADGDIPVHINAIGAAEYYNCNRKGDAFSENTCRDRHHTFVTSGKNYIHHWNKDPDYNFGKIASSCYNEDMHRIELLVISNGNEAAARRNNGLVLPDKFLDKLEKNAEVAVSMGCNIRYDVCNVCGNKARTRAEYCDENTCRNPKTGEYHPGCKHGLTKIADDGLMQSVDNIDPDFFDLSFVGIPADRTGYGFRATYLENDSPKTASVSDKVSEEYLGINKPATGFITGYGVEMSNMLQKLAAIEKQHDKNDVMPFGVCALRDCGVALGCKLASLSPQLRFDGLRYLSKQGILFSPEAFVAAFALPKEAAVEIYAGSQNIYAETDYRYRRVGHTAPATILASLDKAPYSIVAEVLFTPAMINEAIVSEDNIRSNVTRGTLLWSNLCATDSKLACVGSQFRELAEAYALYKAAALCRFPETKRDFGMKLAVWQTVLR